MGKIRQSAGFFRGISALRYPRPLFMPIFSAIMRPVAGFFEPQCAAFIRQAILDNQGGEVFFAAVYGEKGIVSDAVLIARGNLEAAPARLDLQRPCNVVIHNHPSGNLIPSEADIMIASYMLNQENGFLIVDNQVESVNAVTEPGALVVEKPIDRERVAGIFSPTGSLADSHKNFEYRESQAAMAQAASEAFNQGLHAVLEAPTGTGKSLAYLVPLALWALENGKRTLVCTHTINLQQQLLDKDIPLLQAALGSSLRVALVKGRRNYLCVRKLEGADSLQQELFDAQELADVEKILEWAKQTETGSRVDLSFTVHNDCWDKLASDSDSCAGLRCPRGRDCFFRRARREAVDAHILIANHAIFFADMAVRGQAGRRSSTSVFPVCHRVVIDEAHNMEDVATDYFGYHLSGLGLRKKMSRIYSKGKRRSPRGILPAALRRLQEGNKGGKALAGSMEQALSDVFEELPGRISDWFEQLYREFRTMAGGQNLFSLRIVEGVRAAAPFQEVRRILKDMEAALADLSGRINRIYEEWLSLEQSVREASELVVTQLLGFSQRIAADAAFLDAFSRADDEGAVFWSESRSIRGRPALFLHRAPVEVGPTLNEYFYNQYRGVVFTSATLTVGNRFSFFLERSGLVTQDRDKLLTRQLPQVFDYGSQALLAIHSSFPGQGGSGYYNTFADLAGRLIPVTGGRLFFLFTSWRDMDACYQETCTRLPVAWHSNLLKQGDMPRHRLLDSFRARPRAVLFGVNSFWEGVDVQGRELVGVVISKLPFQVPTDPVIQARAELIAGRNGSPFMEYALPQAVLRLKQGFGRLIRTSNDYGFVCILDSRLVQRAYGQMFLDSLPPAARVVGGSDTLVGEIEQFLGGFE